MLTYYCYDPVEVQELFFSGVGHSWYSVPTSDLICRYQSCWSLLQSLWCAKSFQKWHKENNHVQNEYGLVIIYLATHFEMKTCSLFLKNLTFLFIIDFNNLSPKKPNCQQSLSQNWQPGSSHCPMKKAQTDTIHQRPHSSRYQLLWCFVSKYFPESSKWTLAYLRK